ncbi:MAG: hypothetical protein K2M76_00080 [Muribaculaceae bacterium]|nr:hypothetical protein [Muribaculaceae bacterium]
MKLRLTSDEMLNEWCKRKGIGPFRSDSAIRLTYGIDMDAIARMEMRDWYLNLLHTAPPAMLAPTECRTLADMSGGDGSLDIDAKVVRVISLKMVSWHNTATIHPLTNRAMRISTNPFAATVMTPMAIMSGHKLIVAPYEPNDCVESMIAVTDEGPDVYTMDESALTTIKPTTI